MTESEFRPMDSLNLSWPHSVNYHVDIITNQASSTDNGLEDQSPDTDSQDPVTTYNGLPREHVRNSHPLFGNEIRVLDLENGIPGTLLVGSLRRVRLSNSLSNKDVYEPLSYTWEDDCTVQPCKDTTMDDQQPLLYLSDSDCLLKLTSNCAKALCSIRKPTTKRTIWVDSICINQDDNTERSRQVDLMKEIYARAFAVLVYLGRESTQEDNSSNTAMSLLRQPHRLRNLDSRERTSIKRLFDRRYFRRMWIVQEVTLAQTLEFHCGPDITYISKFDGNPLYTISSSKISPPWLRHSKNIRDFLPTFRGEQAEQILNLLFDTALCNCKDDRDRIFALFSLLYTSGEERLRADYSLSTPQVYTGLSAYLATNGFLRGVLMLAPRLALNKSLDLPTWVPDWRSLGKAGLKAPLPDSLPESLSDYHWQHRLSAIRTHQMNMGLGVARSGVMTVRGMFLGCVANSEYSQDRGRGIMDPNEPAASALSSNKRRRDESDRWNGYGSQWQLTSPTHNISLESWKGYFQFDRRSRQPDDVNHHAFMLPDYSTVLILKPNNSFRDQYDLVESGQPLLQITVPKDWPEDFQAFLRLCLLQGMPLDLLEPMTERKQSHSDPMRASKGAFPGLAQFPALWGLNPSTLTMTLTQAAIQKIRCVKLTEFKLLQIWRRHARTCVHVLRDKTQLRLLFDKIKGLSHQDYRQMEAAAGLDQHWSLDHFLGLFIRDPYKGQPMMWPNAQLYGATSEEELDVLPQLMQWAYVTRQLLALVSQGRQDDHVMDYAIDVLAVSVAEFQVSTVSVNATTDESGGPGRTSILLERILCQIQDESNVEVEQVEGPICRNECYWDWKRFDSVMEQRFYYLGVIKTDVEEIQEYFHSLHPEQNFRRFAIRQTFAAHGVDVSKNDFTQIQIR